jgi:hypothetical protein
MVSSARPPSHYRRRCGGAVAALAGALLLVLTSTHLARAEGAWEDRYRGQCCYETIESGAIEPQYFEFVNAGSETWGAAGAPSVALGTDEPRERESSFVAPDWSSVTRPVGNVSHPVLPGESYTFAFDVKAPIVAEPTVFVEQFALVAEGITWMDSDSGLGTTAWLEYRVVPAVPPTITITSSASTLTQGSVLNVEVSATSVASLNHIDIAFAGQEHAEVIPRDPATPGDEQTAWHASATFQTSSLGSGPQTIVATAVDDAGLSSTTTATVNISPATVTPSPTSSPGPALPPTPPPIVPEFGITIAGRAAPRHRVRLTRIVVSGASRDARITIKCKRCVGPATIVAAAGARHSLTLHPHAMEVRSESELAIYVVSPTAYGRYSIYDFKQGVGDAALRKHGCLLPGKTTPVTCPA